MTRPTPKFDSPEQEVYLSLWRTYDRLRMLEDELFNAHDLTAQQYNALRLLRAAHPRELPTLALAQRLVSRAPDITRLLDKLERRQLIRRRRPPDNRRLVHVSITPVGLRLLADLQPHIRACHQRQLGHLTPRDRQQLVALLQKARAPHETTASRWGVES